jgi:spoIIIJ-associated protein
MTPEIQSTIMEFINLFIKPIDAELSVSFEKESNQYRVLIKSKKEADLVGEKGFLLKSFQHLLRVLVHCRYPDDKTHFILDINNYKKERERKIKTLIPEIAKNKVLNEGKTVIITGLSGYERMIVHKILGDSKEISTSSVGEESNRKMLIMPNSEFGATGIDQAIIININSFKESDMNNF